MAVETRILKKSLIAEGTLAVRLAKPEGFAFKAGQSLDLTLLNPPETDSEGNTRAFSIASAPHEPDLLIATRLRDTAFKRVLRNAPDGVHVNIDGPFGSFTLHHDARRPAVFLMGGIGITPARSILMDASARKLPHPLYLFYSNRRPEDAAFLDELMHLEKENPNYKFVGTMTGMDASKKTWGGETGYLDKAMLMRYVPDLASPIYYLAGPPAMVGAMRRRLLNESGVNDDEVKTEEFSGY